MTENLPDDVTPWEPLDDPADMPPPHASSTDKCVAIQPSGFACYRKPIPGGNVCEKHGGAAKQVKRAAQLRLAALIEPAIATLAREMVQADKSVDRQRAANSLLDRAGVTRQNEVEHGDAREILVARLLELQQKRDTTPNTPTTDEGPHT